MEFERKTKPSPRCSPRKTSPTTDTSQALIRRPSTRIANSTPQSNQNPSPTQRLKLDVLPVELRRRIAAYAAGNNVSPGLPNIIIISFRARAVSASSNGLVNGPIIRFNSQRDIVLLDVRSLYALGLYVDQGLENSRTREFLGLNLIQNLATPLEGVNLESLAAVRGLDILPGVTRIMTTSEIDDGLLSAEWLAYVNKLSKQQRDVIDPLERGIMDLRRAPELTNRQFTQLTDERNNVTQDVSDFFNDLQPARQVAAPLFPGAMVFATLTFLPAGAPLAPPPPPGPPPLALPALPPAHPPGPPPVPAPASSQP
ncbi:hypothetical protein N431DRAFT_450041 [Stipitochalara longipes BDJ]|nr:hypothetical protein N431DRAFT_450041 [Stipitochalara longipes BDJ]